MQRGSLRMVNHVVGPIQDDGAPHQLHATCHPSRQLILPSDAISFDSHDWRIWQCQLYLSAAPQPLLAQKHCKMNLQK